MACFTASRVHFEGFDNHFLGKGFKNSLIFKPHFFPFNESVLPLSLFQRHICSPTNVTPDNRQVKPESSVHLAEPPIRILCISKIARPARGAYFNGVVP